MPHDPGSRDCWYLEEIRTVPAAEVEVRTSQAGMTAGEEERTSLVAVADMLDIAAAAQEGNWTGEEHTDAAVEMPKVEGRTVVVLERRPAEEHSAAAVEVGHNVVERQMAEAHNAVVLEKRTEEEHNAAALNKDNELSA